MNISSTINRVNGIKEALENEISEQLEQIKTDLAVYDMEQREQQPAADPQEITPQQLIAALDILTLAYNHMDGEQFIQYIHPDANSTTKWYWLELFDKMRNFGWCSLWPSSAGNMHRDEIAAGILKFFNQQKESK